MSSSGSIPGCGVGAFVNGLENLEDFQSQIGKKLALVLIYTHWTDPFPQKEVEIIHKNGSIPLLTWEPWIKGGLDAILSGEYDEYINTFFQTARDYGQPLLLRFAHEMNGNWYPWDGEHNGQESGPETYKKAWLYIYNVRKRLGADNCQLVWCPNNTDQPPAAWNRIKNYYPGDELVDWVGMDGYNWGYGAWQSFAAVFDAIYQELTTLTGKPLMIGEFASAGQGGGKTEWIKDAFLRIEANYPRIKAFCWFNINKERDWRVDFSAARQALRKNYFSARIIN